MQKYKFIINPVPLKHKHRLFLEKLNGKMLNDNVNFSYEYTTKSKSAVSIAKNASKNFSVIVACGGDGTVMEVINGIYNARTKAAKTKPKLGILPLGTSNDFAKHLGINLGNCTKILLRGKTKKIDLGLAEFAADNKKNKMLFCSTSGIGFDAKLLQLNIYPFFIKMKKIFRNLIYPICGSFMMFWHKSCTAEIRLNSKTVRLKLFMLNANFVKSMSGMKVTPNADVDNGAFELFVAEETSLVKKLIGFLWYSLTSKKINFKEIHNFSNVKGFSVSSKNKIDVQLNGDFVGYTPAKFRVMPEALEVLR